MPASCLFVSVFQRLLHRRRPVPVRQAAIEESVAFLAQVYIEAALYLAHLSVAGVVERQVKQSSRVAERRKTPS